MSNELGDFSCAVELDDYLEIVKIFCAEYPELVHYVTKDSNYTPSDITQIIMMRIPKVKQNEPHIKRLEEIWDVLKATSVVAYRKKKKRWEDAGFNMSNK